MTYILGANYNDGIVLVADRKVTFKENRSNVDYREKLFGYPSDLYYPIVVGCAGSTVLSDQWTNHISTTTNSRCMADELEVMSWVMLPHIAYIFGRYVLCRNCE
jgi:hypothetical protein